MRKKLAPIFLLLIFFFSLLFLRNILLASALKYFISKKSLPVSVGKAYLSFNSVAFKDVILDTDSAYLKIGKVRINFKLGDIFKKSPLRTFSITNVTVRVDDLNRSRKELMSFLPASSESVGSAA